MQDDAPDVALANWAKTGGGGDDLYLHGTAVAVDGRAVLILGRSGSGKSHLALALITHGGTLISDDGVRINAPDGVPHARRPDTATDLIEVRGVGLLTAGPICAEAPLALVIDLDRAEETRLPPRRMVAAGRRTVPLIYGAGVPFLHHALLQMLRYGRAVPPHPEPSQTDVE